MNLWDTIKLALRALNGNKLRSALTLLIIAFGIMALIGILTSIEAIKSKLTADFVQLGAGAFTIQRSDGLENWKDRNSKPAIEIEQAELFKERFTFPSTVSFYSDVESNAVVKSPYKESNPNVLLGAADFDYLQVSGKSIRKGRSFSQLEVDKGNPVAILGFDVAAKLYQYEDSIIGSDILVEGKRYNVIGFTEAKGASAGSNDNYVLIPYKAALKDFTSSGISFDIIVETNNTDQLDWSIEEATGVFRNIRKLDISQENNFFVSRSDKISEMYISNMSMIQNVSMIIGFLTLIGAGVGLMNIMLVSVNERTREIGISKSLGATSRTIFLQFLTEAVSICVIGGASGVLLGVIFGNLVSKFFLQAGFVLAVGWVIFGLVFCTIIGLVAGIYPAIRASRLNPVEALRYE